MPRESAACLGVYSSRGLTTTLSTGTGLSWPGSAVAMACLSIVTVACSGRSREAGEPTTVGAGLVHERGQLRAGALLVSDDRRPATLVSRSSRRVHTRRHATGRRRAAPVQRSLGLFELWRG